MTLITCKWVDIVFQRIFVYCTIKFVFDTGDMAVHRFVGDEYGYLSVLKYESREGSLELLPYHIPPNLIAGNGIAFRNLVYSRC